MKESRLKGIFEEEKKGKKILYTENLIKDNPVYGEKILTISGKQFREWDHTRSKLAAAIQKGISQIGIKPGSIVLYLGAASGTTPSHVSDIVKNGFVYCLDFAYRVVRDLYFLCHKRNNMAPLFFDANFPETYAYIVGKVDVVYQDIAQRNQVDIFLKNCKVFLKEGGFGLLFVKARCIDSVKKPSIVFKEVRSVLEKSMKIVDYRELDPFEVDHCVFVVKK